MATIASLHIAKPRFIASETRPVRVSIPVRLSYPLKSGYKSNRLVKWNRLVKPVKATSEGGISDKVEKSIKEAKETCADDPVSGECVAAWDEVEELSAAASHARDRKKTGGSDPLEEYCSENPETDECRMHDN